MLVATVLSGLLQLLFNIWAWVTFPRVGLLTIAFITLLLCFRPKIDSPS